MAIKKNKFYSLDPILSKGALYNVIFGERSNGKTYSVLKYALEQYANGGHQLALVRRWQDDFTGKRGATMFDALVANGEVERITHGAWTNVYYWGSRWFLCRYEDDKRISDETPFCIRVFAFLNGARQVDVVPQHNNNMF